jgi:hypothetical protein
MRIVFRRWARLHSEGESILHARFAHSLNAAGLPLEVVHLGDLPSGSGTACSRRDLGTQGVLRDVSRIGG